MRAVCRGHQVNFPGDVALQDVEPRVAEHVLDTVQLERFGVAPRELQFRRRDVERRLRALACGLDLDVPLTAVSTERQDVITQVFVGANWDVNSDLGLDGYFKGWIKRQVANYVAVALERSGGLDLYRERLAPVRLTSNF